MSDDPVKGDNRDRGDDRPDPAHDALILSVLREVLARQAAIGAAAASEAIASTTATAGAAGAATASADTTPPAGASTTSPTAPATAAAARPPTVAAGAKAARWQVDPESGLSQVELDRIAEYEARAAEPPEAPLGVARSLRRLLVGVLLAAAVVNVPLVQGRPLSQALPDRQALVIRDGLLLKGPGPEIYELEDGQRRWLSSLDIFEQRGHTWGDVHIVDADYLALFPEGRPIFALLKCSDSPHVYRLEDGERRWIKDIDTFQAEGHVWEEINYRTCADLAAIPLGPPIPPDAGYPERDASTGPVPTGRPR